jgi:hypothetical protein
MSKTRRFRGSRATCERVHLWGQLDKGTRSLPLQPASPEEGGGTRNRTLSTRQWLLTEETDPKPRRRRIKHPADSTTPKTSAMPRSSTAVSNGYKYIYWNARPGCPRRLLRCLVPTVLQPSLSSASAVGAGPPSPVLVCLAGWLLSCSFLGRLH